MFNLLKNFLRREPIEKELAYDLYLKATELSRNLELYESYQVPDTIDGRFDLLTLVVSLFMDRLEQCEDQNHASLVGQFLFDIMFQDMDQSLREKGVGDMGVPRRMKAMLEGFNGRHSRYRIILSDYRRDDCDDKKVKTQLDQTILKNIYNDDSQREADAHELADNVLIAWRDRLASLEDDAFLSVRF